MPDERTKRGLAVREALARKHYARPDLDRGMSELAALRARLRPQDLAAIESMDARYGAAGIREGLATAGLSPDALHAFDALYQRGGLQAVARGVVAQAQAEAHATAAQDATAALERLGDRDWAAAAQILAAGGPEALARRAVQLGMSPEAAAAAVRFVAENGPDGARQAVSERVAARTRADALQALAERDFAAAQKDPRDPFAAQEIHQTTLEFVHAHGAALQAAGVGLKDGESPTAWLRRVARSEGAAEKVAQASGAPLQAARTILERARLYEDHNALSAQLRASDEKERKARAVPLGDRKAAETPKRKPDPLDAAYAKARAAMPPEERRPVRAESVEDAAVALAAGHEFKLTTAGKRHAARAVERRNAPKGDALDRAIHEAEARLSGRAEATDEDTSTDVETMNGGNTDAE